MLSQKLFRLNILMIILLVSQNMLAAAILIISINGLVFLSPNFTLAFCSVIQLKRW